MAPTDRIRIPHCLKASTERSMAQPFMEAPAITEQFFGQPRTERWKLSPHSLTQMEAGQRADSFRRQTEHCMERPRARLAATSFDPTPMEHSKRWWHLIHLPAHRKARPLGVG